MRERANSLMINGHSSSEVEDLLEGLEGLTKEFPGIYANLLEILKRYIGFLHQDIDS